MSSINNNSGAGPLPPFDPNNAAPPANPSAVPSKAAKEANKADAASTVLATDQTFAAKDGIIAEKKRTGFAALAAAPPLPPNAPVLTDAHLQQFSQLQSEYTEGLQKGAPTNQPSVQSLAQQLNAIDRSTPDGQRQAATLQAQISHAALAALAVASSGDSLAGFLMMAVSDQGSQRDAQQTLLDLTARGRQAANDQQMKARAEQAEKQQKAAEKQKKFAFLKPLIAILTVVLSLVTLSGPLLAIALVGAAAGFIGGGIKGGKDKGNGFDLSSALEGAGIGAGAGAGLAAVGSSLLMKGITSFAPKLIPEVAGKAGADTTKTSTKLIGEQGAKAGSTGVTQSVQTGIENATKSAWKRLADQLKRTADRDFVKGLSAKKDEATANAKQAGAPDPATTAPVAPSGGARSGKIGDFLSKVKNTAGKMDDGKYDQGSKFAATGLGMVGDAGSGTVQYGVDKLNAEGDKAAAEAKAAKAFVDMFDQMRDNTMDSAQDLIDKRKESADMVVDLIRSHAETNKKIIGGM